MSFRAFRRAFIDGGCLDGKPTSGVQFISQKSLLVVVVETVASSQAADLLALLLRDLSE